MGRFIYKHRRGTTEQWEGSNVILYEGEIGIEKSNDGYTRFKIGDGVSKYNQLPYANTPHQSLVEYAKKTEVLESLAEYAKKTEVPTKVSELQNDSGYLTEHQSLVEYAKKTEIPTVPESLKNPNALTIKVGGTTTTYDGSEAKTIDVSTGESIPSYWLTHLQTKADKIREVMEVAGRNKSAFLFYTDVHWDAGEKKAPMLLKYLYNNTPINKTIFGGDIVQSESTDRNVMKYLWEWRKQIRELPNHHSVVGNHDDGNGNNNNNMFSTDYIYSFLLAAEETPNIVQGGDMYYYIDEPCEKTRYLYLDTAYIGIDSSQTAFIKEALKTAPDNWHIVAISHIWYAPDYNQYTVRPIPIVGYGTGVESIVDLFDSYNARQGEFSSCTAKVEFCIGGHCHRDYIGRTTGGIPIILCETDSHHNRSGLIDTVGTTSESSVNAIIADYGAETPKVNIIRIGRGKNFEVSLYGTEVPNVPDPTYTPETPETPAYTNMLDTVGYKDGYRLSGSSGNEAENIGTDITNHIPCNSNVTVYMKNVVAPYTSDNSHFHFIACYDKNKAYIGGYSITLCSNVEHDGDGNITSFQTPAGTQYKDTAYIRIGVQDINETSIITVNEPIE